MNQFLYKVNMNEEILKLKINVHVVEVLKQIKKFNK